MNFAIASEHRDFFHKQGYIEFAGLLTEGQLNRLNQDLRQVLVNRLELESHSFLERKTPAELFAVGRDLWRDLPYLKKTVANASWAKIAEEFCQEAPLRLGYVQFIPRQITQPMLKEHKSPFQQMLASQCSLAEISSIQGLVSGLFICLKSYAASEDPALESAIFPTMPGHGIYVSVDHQLDFSQLNKSCEYLLITYAIQKSVYVLNERDPLGFTMRQWGYTLGDALNDKLNPIVLR